MRAVFEAWDGTLFENESDARFYEKFSGHVFVIIDDDPEILELISDKLKRLKINFHIFQDPLQGMNFIAKNKVTHVFTDYHMHNYGMSGKWIKDICAEKNIRCSIISHDDDLADIPKKDFLSNFLNYL